MAAVDAQGTTFTIDGTAIGGVDSYELLQGEPREATMHFLKAGAAPASRPLDPDYGRCTLNLIRDKNDAGQIILAASLASRTRHTFAINYDDGTSDTFYGCTLQLPTRGSKSADTPVNLSRCVIRINGAIT